MLPDFVLAGLVLDGIGAVMLARPLLHRQDTIEEMATYTDTGAMYDAPGGERTIEALVETLRRDKRWGIAGTVLLVAGFTLQFIGRVV